MRVRRSVSQNSQCERSAWAKCLRQKKKGTAVTLGVVCFPQGKCLMSRVFSGFRCMHLGECTSVILSCSTSCSREKRLRLEPLILGSTGCICITLCVAMDTFGHPAEPSCMSLWCLQRPLVVEPICTLRCMPTSVGAGIHVVYEYSMGEGSL